MQQINVAWNVDFALVFQEVVVVEVRAQIQRVEVLDHLSLDASSVKLFSHIFDAQSFFKRRQKHTLLQIETPKLLLAVLVKLVIRKRHAKGDDA